MKSSLLVLAIASLTLPAHAQFDNGGGGSRSEDSSPVWDQFRLNTKKRVKLDFRNANVDAVLSFLQKATGVTIVKDPALTGTITLTSAKAVSLREAIQILSTTLGLKNYELRKEGALLVIAQRQQRRDNGGGGGMPPIDFPMPERSELKVYPIKYANASQVARVVNDVFTQQGGGGLPGGFQFGGGGGGGGGRFGQQGGNQGGRQQFNPQLLSRFGQQTPQVRASADDFSNSVIVNAPSKQQREVSDLIKQIDKETDAPLRTRVFKLTYATAADLQPVVNNVLTSNAPKGRGGASTQQQQQQNLPFFLRGTGATAGLSSVAAETRSNSLIVTTTDENQRLVEQLVTELDKPQEYATTTFVFPLMNARADQISTLLNQAFGSRQGTGANTRNATTGAQRTNTATGNRNTTGGNNGGLGGRSQADSTADPQAQASTTMEVPLQDPNSENGELMTSISVAQGGGFGQIFGGGGGFNQNRTGQNQNQTARTPDGRIVNVRDLTNQITVIPDNNTNSVIVVANPDSAQMIQQILDQLDRIPEQVMIETLIVEASLDDTTRLGVEFGLNLQNIFRSKTNVTGTTDFGLANANPAVNGARYTLSGGDVTAFINAVKTDSRFNILSTPRIFTSNNQQAQINISQSIPYVLSTRQDVNGNLSFNYAFQDVGVVLTVTPRITSNGYVTMDVSQTANDLQGYTSFNAPIVNQREADTTVSVLDGETIVLGGIIRNSVTSTTNKVPLLGDIPLLGNLFRSTSKTKNKTELLVLLTPHVVRDDADARRLRLDQQRRLSKPTRDQLDKEIPPENGPVDAPREAPGTKKGTPPPSKKTTPPPPSNPPTTPKKNGQS